MRTLLLAIIFSGAVFVADGRSIHVDALNGTVMDAPMANPVLELNVTDMPADTGENHLTEKDIDDILFVLEHSKNYTTKKALKKRL